MLYITSADGKSHSWHVGEKLGVDPVFVHSIQADGHELATIRSVFGTTIPTVQSKAAQIWYGDLARTILFNLDGISDVVQTEEDGEHWSGFYDF